MSDETKNEPGKEEKAPNFEKALERLEYILEKMNSGTLALEEALKMYEEADRLIASCNKKLNDAERRIEILMKARSGEIATGADGKPQTQPFNPNNNS
jgi:exodeoxyribonuclease VII small subunit